MKTWKHEANQAHYRSLRSTLVDILDPKSISRGSLCKMDSQLKEAQNFFHLDITITGSEFFIVRYYNNTFDMRIIRGVTDPSHQKCTESQCCMMEISVLRPWGCISASRGWTNGMLRTFHFCWLRTASRRSYIEKQHLDRSAHFRRDCRFKAASGSALPLNTGRTFFSSVFVPSLAQTDAHLSRCSSCSGGGRLPRLSTSSTGMQRALAPQLEVDRLQVDRAPGGLWKTQNGGKRKMQPLH